MDEKLATLIGLLLSDGSIFFDRSKRTFCIQFTNKVSGLLDMFKELMRDCFGLTNFSVNRCSNAVSIRFFSAKVARSLLKLSPSFRTNPCNHFPVCNGLACDHSKQIVVGDTLFPPCKIPDEIFISESFMSAFIRGFASGDGSVFVNPKDSQIVVEICCWHPILKEQIIIALKKLDIPCRFDRHSVFVSGKTNCKLFLNKVGFMKESIVCDRRSKWFGTPKNTLLQIGCDLSCSQPNCPPNAVLLRVSNTATKG